MIVNQEVPLVDCHNPTVLAAVSFQRVVGREALSNAAFTPKLKHV